MTTRTPAINIDTRGDKPVSEARFMMHLMRKRDSRLRTETHSRALQLAGGFGNTEADVLTGGSRERRMRSDTY